MNKVELIEALAGRTELPKSDVSRVLEALFAPTGIVTSELRKGGRVRFSGFGSFHSRTRPARLGRDPRTGSKIPIGSWTVAVFRPAQSLRDVLNRRGSSG